MEVNITINFETGDARVMYLNGNTTDIAAREYDTVEAWLEDIQDEIRWMVRYAPVVAPAMNR
jgi:hypothetical protein